MQHQNCYWGYGEKYSMRPENWPRNIRRTSEKLQNVKITNIDFEEVIESVSDGAFLFIDPPYFNAEQDKFYVNSLSKDNHFRLCEIFKRHKQRIKFIITDDNSEEIINLYEWALEIHEKEWNYTINRTDDQKKGKSKQDNFKGERYRGKEIFILNYSYIDSNFQKSEQLSLKI